MYYTVLYWGTYSRGGYVCYQSKITIITTIGTNPNLPVQPMLFKKTLKIKQKIMLTDRHETIYEVIGKAV